MGKHFYQYRSDSKIFVEWFSLDFTLLVMLQVSKLGATHGLETISVNLSHLRFS